MTAEDWARLADIVFRDADARKSPKQELQGRKRQIYTTAGGVSVYVYDHEEEMSQPPKDPGPFNGNKGGSRNRTAS